MLLEDVDTMGEACLTFIRLEKSLVKGAMEKVKTTLISCEALSSLMLTVTFTQIQFAWLGRNYHDKQSQ